MSTLSLATFFILITVGQVFGTVSTDDHTVEQILCNGGHELNSKTVTFLSSITYLVHPGNFCLIENVNRLTISGDNPLSLTTIKCLRENNTLSSRGFGFFQAVNLVIENVKFEDCGGVLTTEALKYSNDSYNNFYFGPGRSAVLLFNHCSDFTLQNVLFTNYMGYAVVAFNPFGGVNLNKLSVTNNIKIEGTSPECNVIGLEQICKGSGMLLKFFNDHSKSQDTGGNITVSNSEFIANKAKRVSMESKNCSDIVFDRFSAPFYLPVLLPSVGALTVIYEQDFNVLVNIVNTSFVNNQGQCFGSAAVFFLSQPTFSTHTFSKCTFRNNTPSKDHRVSSNQNFIGSAVTSYMVLKNESDVIIANCLSIIDSEFYRDVNPEIHTIPFISLSQLPGTLGDCLVRLSNLTAKSDSSFLHIQHVDGGSDLDLEMVDLQLLGSHSFTVEDAYQDDSSITNGVMEFVNLYSVTLSGTDVGSCSFHNLIGPVIVATASNLEVSGNITFNDNHGFVWVDGTAIRLQTNSYLWLKEPTNLVFENNTAIVGGAIFSSETQTPFCTIQYSTENVYTPENITKMDVNLTFIHNSAHVAGNSIYITRLYRCSVQISNGIAIHSSQIPAIYDSIFHFERTVNNSLQEVSSRPYTVCLCDGSPSGSSSTINCVQNSYTNNPMRTYPGKTIQFGMIPIDNNYKPVYAVVFVVVGRNAPFNNELDWRLGYGQDVIQMSGSGCFQYNFTIFSKAAPTNGELSILLFDSEQRFTIPIELQACPPGFERSPGNGFCECSELLKRFDVHCDINTETMTRPMFSWIGVTNIDETNETDRIGFAYHCPLRYCSPHIPSIFLKDPSASFCIANRTGILCGQCPPPLSTVVGDDECLECSNWYLLTLPLYAIAGLLLVVVLFLLRLTVTPGTINGLVFYANLLYVNRTVFLGIPGLYWLRVFLATINLRIGFPLCLYDGMTTIASSHLAYLFPIYLWVMALVIVLISRYSDKVAHLIGRSAVPVLASLIYISYNNMLASVVDGLSYLDLYYEDANGTIHSREVWYFDGNVDYFTEGHLSLFVIVILTLLFILIPYTILLTGVKQFSRYRIVDRFRPLIDAYCAPYKDKWRFWFGARLWVLIAVYVSYAVSRNDITTLFLAECIILAAFTFTQLLIMPFKSFAINVLDSFFMINALFLSIIGLYTQELDKIRIGSGILVGTVFFAFVCIIVYHIWDVTGRKDLSLCFQRIRTRSSTYRSITATNITEESKEAESESETPQPPKIIPTYQVLSYHPEQLRESVLDSATSVV